jgi:hypothetical protein
MSMAWANTMAQIFQAAMATLGIDISALNPCYGFTRTSTYGDTLIAMFSACLSSLWPHGTTISSN